MRLSIIALMRRRGILSQHLLLCLALAILVLPSRPASAQPLRRAWGSRPLLSYFTLTASLQAPLRLGAQLSTVQFAQVRRVAEGEQMQLRRLYKASQPVLSDPTLSLEHKRLYLQRTVYNRRVGTIVYASDRALRLALDAGAYTRLVSWIEARWPIEVQAHGWKPTSITRFLTLDPLLWREPLAAPRTYEIFATRYDAKGRYTAALPDQCVKLTNGGLSTCADKGYVAGQRYEIFMSHKNGKKGVGVVVAEAGPWNIDDNFWATPADPTPRRMFADLGLGMPEAQAAFYNGYNGGLDQYGRKVTAPFAIDLAFEVAGDLGLPPRTNDWINVSFMWTDGWGSGNGSGSGAGQSASAPPAAIAPVETAAYKPDGSQVHSVQSGQTLWAIAVAYGTTIQRLQALNGLGESAVILPGQELLVRPAGPVPTGAEAATADLSVGTPGVLTTDSAPDLSTRAPLAGIVETATRSPAYSPVDKIANPSENEAATATSPGNSDPGPLLYIIVGMLIAGLALYIFGRWLLAR